ncbi:hypothetical protein B0H14DRAFT_2631121 [Mycena olivaceomarginata]|nr:hypothetical protein B0H14DRAFT_2631121 [Mycena olivaceomarginata]
MADAVAVIQNQDRPLGEQWEMRHWYIDYDALAAANVSVPSTLFASYDYTVHLSRRHRVRAELLAIDTAVARLIWNSPPSLNIGRDLVIWYTRRHYLVQLLRTEV